MSELRQALLWYLGVALMALWIINHKQEKKQDFVLMLDEHQCQYWKYGKFLMPVMKDNKKVCNES